jgi:hypothetical protein
MTISDNPLVLELPAIETFLVLAVDIVKNVYVLLLFIQFEQLKGKRTSGYFQY